MGMNATRGTWRTQKVGTVVVVLAALYAVIFGIALALGGSSPTDDDAERAAPPEAPVQAEEPLFAAQPELPRPGGSGGAPSTSAEASETPDGLDTTDDERERELARAEAQSQIDEPNAATDPPSPFIPQPTPLPLPTPATGSTSAFTTQNLLDERDWFEVRRTKGDIMSVNFFDGFEYALQGQGRFTVENGYFQTGTHGERDFLAFHVDDVHYGDVTGDGFDDAIVSVRQGHWSGDPYPFVQVYAITDGLLEFWGSSYSSYASDGGIAEVVVRDGLINLEHWNWDRSTISTSSWAVMASESYLQRIEGSGERVWVDLAGRTDIVEVEARGDHLRATVSSDGSGVFAFTSQAGWAVAPSVRSGDVTVRVRSASTGEFVGDVASGEELVLVRPGRYTAELISTRPTATTVDIDVADQRTLRAPEWEPAMEFAAAHVEGRRVYQRYWPTFTSSHGVAGVEGANAAIEAAMNDIRARYETEVAKCTNPAAVTQTVHYFPTLISYDLVGFDISESWTTCNGDHQFANHSLILDMNTGTEVPGRAVVDLDAASFQGAWKQRIIKNGWLEDLTESDIEIVAFEEFSVHAWGVGIGASMRFGGEDVGHWYERYTFDELDGVIDESFVIRAASGSTALIPFTEGCGC